MMIPFTPRLVGSEQLRCGDDVAGREWVGFRCACSAFLEKLHLF